MQYKVRWAGFEEDEDTWEPLDNLGGAKEQVDSYESENKKGALLTMKCLSAACSGSGASTTHQQITPVGVSGAKRKHSAESTPAESAIPRHCFLRTRCGWRVLPACDLLTTVSLCDLLPEHTNLMKLSTVELAALVRVLPSVPVGTSRSDMIKALQKVIDEWVPPVVRLCLCQRNKQHCPLLRWPREDHPLNVGGV